MITFLHRILGKLLHFVVDTVKKLTLISTLFAVAVCLVLFFVYLYADRPLYALVSLAGTVCFVHINKQF